MIVKQNLYTITENEKKALELGYYVHRQNVINKDGRLICEDVPTSYFGSSLQRRRKVDEIRVKQNQKEEFKDCTLRKVENPLNPALDYYIPFKQPKKQEKKVIEHTFSQRSKSKIANKMIAWARANKAKKGNVLYNFITLTLTSPQIGTDRDFTAMQNVFMTYLRKYFNVKNYIYVLERQTKNTNNIHSHIIIDQYVPYERLNRVWCKILGDNGYTFPSHNYITGETQIVSVSQAMKNYDNSKKYTGEVRYINPRTHQPIKPTKEVNKPNPLDGETVHNIKAISYYVTKYITKNNSVINTTLWNCSKSISQLWTGCICNPQLYYANLSSQTSRIVQKILDNGQILNVCLLSHYTKVQEKLFEINHKILFKDAS